MAVQNAYNNYIKRQTNGITQKPINNFKEKVKNSLGGVQTQQTQGNSANTPITTPPVSQPKPMQARTNINTQVTTPNPVETPVAPQNTTPTVNPVATPATTPQAEGGAGMMSLADVNSAFESTEQANTPVVTSAEVAEVANDPGVQQRAYSEGKTPQQMAQELLEEQKKQLQADWEMKQKEIELQRQQAQDSFNQSKGDAENAYNESIDKINQDRYDRQQDLNVSGSKRGIQYSPQQLGLETVANINTNKNITEAGKQRNELLNKLQLQLNELNANLVMSSENSLNDYNKALSELNANYANKIMDWEWNQQQTDDERKWQESQTQADREWQEKMNQTQNAWQAEQDRLDKEWQANQNQLDRDKYGRSSGSSYSSGGRSYGYSSSYSPYSRSGYSNYSSNYQGYDDSAFDLSDEVNSLAYEKTFKELSDDSMSAYSDMRTQPYNEKLRSELYTDDMKQDIDYAKANGMSPAGIRNLTKEYDYNQNKLFETFGRSKKDNVLQEGNKRFDHALKTNLTPTAIGRNQANMMLERNKDLASGKKMNTAVKSNSTKTKEKVKTDLANKSPLKQSSKNTAKNKLENATKNSSKSTKTSKTKEAVKKSVSNAKTSSKNSAKNAKTSTKKSASNVKKSTSKAKENIKKNIKKIFKKKK